MLVGSSTSTSAAAAGVSSCPVSDQSSKVEQMETLGKNSRVIRNGDTSSSPAAVPASNATKATYRENQEPVGQQNEAETIQQQSTQEEEVDLLRNCDGIRY